MSFYKTRLRQFCRTYNDRDLAALTPLDVDEYLAEAGTGVSDSTRHHNAVAIGERQTGPIFLSPAGRAWTVPRRRTS